MNSFSSRVAAAAEAIRGIFPETPLQENDYLSKKTGARILLKREDLTPVRSYKIRGAFNFFRKAPPPATMPSCSSAPRPATTRRALPSSAVISAKRAWCSCP